MDAVAEVAGLGRSRFYEIFKTETGMSPADYFMRLKCRSARNDLLSGNDSVTAIAMRYGFSSSQYFATCFKKFTGMTPREFRQSKRDTANSKRRR